jgi:hypothetical protein
MLRMLYRQCAPWLACCLLAATARADNRWTDQRVSGRFEFHAEFSLDEHARLLDELGLLERDLFDQLGIASSRESVQVYLFASKASYQQALRPYFPRATSRKAMYVKQRGPGMVLAFRNDDLAVDLRHEGTHALLHAALPMVPLWLDEGLAEYFETTREDRVHGSPHLKLARWNARLGTLHDIERMERITEVEEMDAAAYRQAWAWAHFMLHGPAEGRDELRRFLADIQAGTPPGKLSERLRRRVPDLDQRFRGHVRDWRQ